MTDAASRTTDSRMQAWAAANTGMAVYSAGRAIIQQVQGTKINGQDNQIATGKTNPDGTPKTRDATAADKVGGITAPSAQARARLTATVLASPSKAALWPATAVSRWGSSATPTCGVGPLPLVQDGQSRFQTGGVLTISDIQNIFDADKVRKDVSAQTFGSLASKLVGDYTKKQMETANQLRADAIKESDAQHKALLDQQAEQIENSLGDNGAEGVPAHTLIGGLAGAAGTAAGPLTKF